MHDPDRTIVAIASPPGRGGVGCVRISGPDAVEVARHLWRGVREALAEPRAGVARFGRLVDRDGETVDHGYAVRFDPPRSYTGETVVELWAHGSPVVLGALVGHALERGAVPAGPGEFTYRAFRRGRIDLTEAEAVRDLIDARTRHQVRVALSQAEGTLSRALAPLREALDDQLARAEAAIEFEDEAETHRPHGEFRIAIAQVRQECGNLLARFRAGRIVREGATVVLTGLPNVGKSSLFNRLLARERAIVSATPGTTLDTLEEGLDLGGVPATLVDTAGLREVAGEVEGEGIRRAQAARNRADLVLLVLEAGRRLATAECEALEHARGDRRWLVIVNKSDLVDDLRAPADAVVVSARTGYGCERLVAALTARLRETGGPIEDPIVTHARHAEALRAASAALERAERAAEQGFTEEVVLEDLREARGRLAEIVGQLSTEALYDRVFSTFCIGK